MCAHVVFCAFVGSVAAEYAVKTPGYFDYHEFQAFLMGRPAKEQGDVKRPSMGADQPALIACLVNVNNHNLHKVFKNLDTSELVVADRCCCCGSALCSVLHASAALPPASPRRL